LRPSFLSRQPNSFISCWKKSRNDHSFGTHRLSFSTVPSPHVTFFTSGSMGGSGTTVSYSSSNFDFSSSVSACWRWL